MFDKMKQLMEVKKQAELIKQELENTTIDIQDVQGIQLSITGAQKFKSVHIDESLLNSANKGQFEQDLLKSLNAAIKKSQDAGTQKMKDVTGLNIPGM